jgi:hypothetical protein
LWFEMSGKLECYSFVVCGWNKNVDAPARAAQGHRLFFLTFVVLRIEVVSGSLRRPEIDCAVPIELPKTRASQTSTTDARVES